MRLVESNETHSVYVDTYSSELLHFHEQLRLLLHFSLAQERQKFLTPVLGRPEFRLQFGVLLLQNQKLKSLPCAQRRFGGGGCGSGRRSPGGILGRHLLLEGKKKLIIILLWYKANKKKKPL